MQRILKHMSNKKQHVFLKIQISSKYRQRSPNIFQKLCFKIAQKCLKSSPKKHNTKNNSPICNGRQDSQVRKKTQQLVTDIALSCLLRPEGYIIIYYRILYYIILYICYPKISPGSHGGPNLGRRLARGQLRLCVGGASSLVGAGEIWALTNCLEMFFGFSKVFWRKNSRQKWVWNYFLMIFPAVCLFCLEELMAEVWEIPCPSEKE